MWLCIFIKHQNSTLPVLIKYSNNWGILKDDTLVYYDVKYGSQKPIQELYVSPLTYSRFYI